MANDKIVFNREAVGVVAKNQWRDAEDLAQIGRAVGRTTRAVAFSLPGPGGSGPSSLNAAVGHFNKGMRLVILEYSDAAANLGSGTESAGANFDSTEQYNRERAARLGVDWN